MSKKTLNREKNFNSISGNKLKEYYSSDKKDEKVVDAEFEEVDEG